MLKKEAAKITSVVVIVGTETKRVRGNSSAKKLKQQALALTHDLGHKHILEHDIRFGLAADWPAENPGILMLALDANRMPIPKNQPAAANAAEPVAV